MTHRTGEYEPSLFQRCYDFDESAFSNSPASTCEKAAKVVLYLASFTVVVPIGLYIVSTCYTGNEEDKVERIRVQTFSSSYGSTNDNKILENTDIKTSTQLEEKWNSTISKADKETIANLLKLSVSPAEIPLDSIVCFQTALEQYKQTSQDDIFTLVDTLLRDKFLLFSLCRVFQYSNMDKSNSFDQFVRDVNHQLECQGRCTMTPINYYKYDVNHIRNKVRLFSAALYYKAAQLSILTEDRSQMES